MYIKSTMQKNYMPNAIMHSQLFYIKEIWSICLVIEQNCWEKNLELFSEQLKNWGRDFRTVFEKKNIDWCVFSKWKRFFNWKDT